MELKQGDRVRFLNTKGGGVVVKQVNSYMVLVAIEDGFEVPVLINEIVKINDSPSGKLFLNSEEKNYKKAEIPQEQQEIKIAEKKEIVENNILDDDFDEKFQIEIQKDNSIEKGVFIGWFLSNNNQILSGNIDVYIINNTQFDILFSVFLKKSKNGYFGFDYGSLEPNKAMIIDKINSKNYDKWLNGNVQIIFFHDKVKQLQMPVSSNFSLKSDVFSNADNFQDFKLLSNQKGIVHFVYKYHDEANKSSDEENIKFDNQISVFNSKLFEIEPIINKHRISENVAEVDLHISALIDNFSKMSAHEILQYQLKYFDKILQSAFAYQYKKLIIIHGIGNGVLKNAILNRVSQDGDIKVQDASFAKYGYGAIELLINS